MFSSIYLYVYACIYVLNILVQILEQHFVLKLLL
jgi:hypothetical protein